MNPGSTVSPDRSITVAPAGTATFGPTAVMRSPCTRITAFFTGAAPLPSMSVPARIAITAAAEVGEGAAGGGDC